MDVSERRSPRKHSIGCLGKMVNVFELKSSQLLLTNTDSKTPMKALIAEELSKEEDPKRAKPNLVAQLMGLETLPHTHSNRVRYPVTRPGATAIKDVYEIGTENEKRLALVRQKFTEAKRLATDEKGCQSKELFDAVEVLSSNKEMFLKFLQEHKSMVSNNLYDIKAPPETKRITVLKPSDSERLPTFDCGVSPTRIVVLKPTGGKLVSGEEKNARSSVFSNGYVGDDEVMSPSWDFVNKVGSPCSNSSTSRMSCSPESSVCREAKKRLSERWAMMSAVPEASLEKVSGTLGEMLSISGTPGAEERDELEMKPSLFCFSGNLDRVGDVPASPQGFLRSKSVPASPQGFLRSKSVPASSSVFETPKKFSLQVSEFFLKNRKSKDRKAEFPRHESECDTSKPTDVKSECGETTNAECVLSVLPFAECVEQPIPISVLEPLRELKANPKPPHNGNSSTVLYSHPMESRVVRSGSEVSLRSNAIGKSPPIGTISRTLSCNDSFIETLRQAKTSPVSSREEDAQPDWIFLLETLLSDGGFLAASPSESSILQKWHSPESPLDPSLREKYSNLDHKELLQEAKRRAMRSYRKLIFDSVNRGLLEFGGGKMASAESVVQYLWKGMRKWFTGEVRWSYGEGDGLEDCSDALRKELRCLGIEIQICLLNQLLDEAVFDLNS